MLPKLMKIPVLVLLVPMPFLSAVLWMGKFSPYIDGNSLGIYITLSLVNAAIGMLLLLLVINKSLPRKMLLAGILLFGMGMVMASVAGLVAPPDFTVAMLKHPEREHYRYVLFFLNALLFAGAFILFLQPGFGKWHKWLLLLFIPALAEMLWEFYHHYYYAENLKIWVDNGENADKFMDHYSGFAAIRFGSAGRLFQYLCIGLMAYVLHINNYIRKWAFISLVFLCAIGIIAAIYIFFNGLNFPAPFQIFMLFFIPGFPFLLLYWIGIGLLTKPSGKLYNK